jgi:polygalacturonase
MGANVATPMDAATAMDAAAQMNAASDAAMRSDAATSSDAAMRADLGAPPDLASDAARPPRVCDVRAYGATGNGTTKDTAALQAAIDDCATTGGTFLSGSIQLRSHITLDVEAPATLLGSQDIADYPDRAPPVVNTQLAQCKKALVYAESADDVHLQGAGTLDGNAAGVATWNGDQVPEGTRPMVWFTVLSTHVSLQDATVRNAGVWAVVNMEITHLTISGLKVHNNLGATHDGIDVVDGHDVTIQNCTIESGDDSICLKSGSATGTIGVTVQNCQTTQSGVANGVKLGTASVGPFRDITVENVQIANAQAAGLAVESVDGSAISNLTFRHITTDHVGTPFFVLLGSRNRDPKQVGSIDGVTFDDVTSTNMLYNWGSIVTGSVVGAQTFGISNISFSNLTQHYNGAGATPNPTPFTVDNFPEYQGPVPGQAAGTLYNQYPDAKFFTGTGGNENTTYHGPGVAVFVRHASSVSVSTCSVQVNGTDGRPLYATKDVTAFSGACSP